MKAIKNEAAARVQERVAYGAIAEAIEQVMKLNDIAGIGNTKAIVVGNISCITYEILKKNTIEDEK